MNKESIIITLTLISIILGCISPRIHYFTTVGTSMEPLISEGDLIECIEQRDYEVGDVVVYNNTWVNAIKCHRITYKDGDHYLMKGDNETMMDQGVQFKKDIICKVKT